MGRKDENLGKIRVTFSNMFSLLSILIKFLIFFAVIPQTHLQGSVSQNSNLGLCLFFFISHSRFV